MDADDKIEVAAELLKGDVGWRVTVRHQGWIAIYKVAPNGAINRISWGGSKKWLDIPPADREAIWSAVKSWWDKRKQDLSRSVPFSPGDSQD